MCSSFFASKDCTYTDSAGRPVPAPNALRPDGPLSQANPTTHSPTSITSSAPVAASGSYQAPESDRFEPGTPRPDAASRDASIPSGFVTKRPSSQSQIDDARQPQGLHLVLPRDLLPPRKRLKNDPELSGKIVNKKLPLVVFLTLQCFAAGCTIHKRMDGTETSAEFPKHILHELINCKSWQPG